MALYWIATAIFKGIRTLNVTNLFRNKNTKCHKRYHTRKKPIRGAMDTFTNDRAQAESSKRVKDILRSYVIKDWQSEPHQQQQNYSERIYQDVKKNTNWVLNWSGAPPQTWLWAFQYCAYIMNRTARKALGWRTPYEALYGQTPNISVMLKFVFWEICYIANYEEDGASFPSESTEIAV